MIDISLVTGAEKRIAQAATGFINELKTLAGNAAVEAIAAEYPGGTAIDQACITLCNDGLDAITAIDTKLETYTTQVANIYNGLAVGISNIRNNNPKRGIGRDFQIVGYFIESLAGAL